MTFIEAKQTAAKLFGPGLKLHRGKNRCFVIRDGMPIGDGRSWLEALRSAGEMQMAKNAMQEAEEKRVGEMIKAFNLVHPEINLAVGAPPLTEEELVKFDAFAEEYDKKTPSAIPAAPGNP